MVQMVQIPNYAQIYGGLDLNSERCKSLGKVRENFGELTVRFLRGLYLRI